MGIILFLSQLVSLIFSGAGFYVLLQCGYLKKNMYLKEYDLFQENWERGFEVCWNSWESENHDAGYQNLWKDPEVRVS